MELGIIGTGKCFPPRAGGATRVFQIIKNLGELGCSVHLFSLDYKKFLKLRNVKVHHCEELRFLRRSLRASDIQKEFRSLARFIRRLKCLEQLDIIQSESIVTMPHTFTVNKLLGKPSVLDEHNVDTMLCYRLSRPSADCKRIHFLETLACKSVDQIFSVSLPDKHLVQRLFRIAPSRVTVIPNGVDVKHFAPSPELRKKIRLEYNLKEKPIILFIGLLNYFPNADALKILVSDICPRVKRLVPHVVFMVVGPHPPAWLIKHVSKDFIVTGVVEDVAPYINASDVCVAPLRSGSGTRIKILEYMACERPVVSTSTGVEGLDVINKEQVIIENNWTKFAEWITLLIQDKELSAKIGRSGRLLTVEQYNWKQIAEKMITTYKKMLS